VALAPATTAARSALPTASNQRPMGSQRNADPPQSGSSKPAGVAAGGLTQLEMMETAHVFEKHTAPRRGGRSGWRAAQVEVEQRARISPSERSTGNRRPSGRPHRGHASDAHCLPSPPAHWRIGLRHIHAQWGVTRPSWVGCPWMWGRTIQRPTKGELPWGHQLIGWTGREGLPGQTADAPDLGCSPDPAPPACLGNRTSGV
jgi:hypothetical protein